MQAGRRPESLTKGTGIYVNKLRLKTRARGLSQSYADGADGEAKQSSHLGMRRLM